MQRLVVALVGTPNVGKSTIFNRIIGERKAIIDDTRGVTRDRIYGTASWLTKTFGVIDTGGIEIKNVPFQTEIRLQAEIAINEADVIVFLTDAKLGVTNDDIFIAKMLQKSKKKVILAVNKVDDFSLISRVNDFYELGFGTPLPLSGVHGTGIGDLLDQIVAFIKEDYLEEAAVSEATIALIGQVNVGKSSLVNAMLNEERVVVSPVAGTTRDSIDTTFTYDGKQYTIIDTAGIRKRGKIYESIDKYALLRAETAIAKSDLVLLVLDAAMGLREQDKHVAQYALDEKKAMVIVVNKWDLISKTENAMSDFKKNLYLQMPFMEFAQVVFVSALKKDRIKTIFTAIDLGLKAYEDRLSTSLLNELVQDAVLRNPPSLFNGGELKIYFANQVDIKPPTFVFFCNNSNFIHFSYKRYLINCIRRVQNFDKTPLELIFRTRK